jgi:hypothetical protein
VTNIRTRHAGDAVAEIMLAERVSLRTSSPDVNDAATELERGFDLLFFLREMDILADELAKLAPSMDRTALELRLAQMRQVVEFRHKQRTDRPEVE